MPIRLTFGDCPICGKGIVYEGGQYCSPACWVYAAKPADPEPLPVFQEPVLPEPDPDPNPEPVAVVQGPRVRARRARLKPDPEPEPDQKREPEQLPSIETDDDFLASLDDG